MEITIRAASVQGGAMVEKSFDLPISPVVLLIEIWTTKPQA
jgi:hypothetical protein